MSKRSGILAASAALVFTVTAGGLVGVGSATAAPGGAKGPKPTTTTSPITDPVETTIYALFCSYSDGTLTARYGPVTGEDVYLTYPDAAGAEVKLGKFDAQGYAKVRKPNNIRTFNATRPGNAEYGDASVILASCTLA